ncbi:MAG: HlyD family efflux transporter periplasmic adaptor subunit [Ruminococcaceae bacterium]|nr:HlyD family efflux transporter periplasmic adaptor subunit [Oscillospiraceae bacterium]
MDYTTAEGLKCFAVEIVIQNPGSLTEGTTVTCWAQDASGGEIYAVDDAKLTYNNVKTVMAGATGELSAVNVVDYERVSRGQVLFVIDASSYETQLETLQKQIRNCEEKIEDLRTSIDTEYTRYADISGRVVTANYSKNRMTGTDMGSVVIYNQDSMEISVNIDELDADYLTEGMDVTVYRTTSSRTVTYPAKLTYLSLEATSGQSGVSTFAATITIDSEGELSSGVTVYYSIDVSGGSDSGAAAETVLAPLNALCSYDGGYYLIVQAESEPENTIDPTEAGGSVTDFPKGYYAVPVEAGDFNDSYIQILSGVEKDTTLFLRYRNTAPAGGDTTSLVSNDEEESASGMPDFGSMPDFSGGNMPSFGGSGMPNFGGGSGGGMPGGGRSGGSGGGMPGGMG